MGVEQLRNKRGRAEAGGQDHVDLGVLGGALGPVVRQLRNHLTVRIAEAFERFGLRNGSYSTMALIASNPGCAQSDIARETGLDKSVVVALVDDLEQRGLARRERSHTDRRRNILTLTEAGHQLVSEMEAVVQSVERPVRDALGRDDMEVLIRLSRKALQALIASEAR